MRTEAQRAYDRLYSRKQKALSEGRNPALVNGSPEPLVSIRLLQVPMPKVKPLCAETDPDLFFSSRPAHREQAKAICGSCESRQECLEGALSRGEKYGIWAGIDFEHDAFAEAS